MLLILSVVNETVEMLMVQRNESYWSGAKKRDD
jgi:hypothetical protein